jgi:hypothetical protein
MLVMDIPSLALYLFPMVVLFTSQLVFFDKLCWMEVDVVGKYWLIVSYTGQWMNKIYWIFKANFWKWDEYKWIVGSIAMFFDNLPTSGQMLVVIFWVSLSTMILFEVFLMGIELLFGVRFTIVDCWDGFLWIAGLALSSLTTDAEEASCTETGWETKTTTKMQ